MKALMKTIILALFLLTGISYGQDSTQLSQITLLGIPIGGSTPKVRMIVQTVSNGDSYYSWEFADIEDDIYTRYSWFYGAPSINGRTNIDISQHNFDIRSDLVLRTTIEYPADTIAIVRAFAGTTEETLIELGSIEVHDGVGVISDDTYPADSNVPFFALSENRKPGMLYYLNLSGTTVRPLFKLFKDGFSFGSDEADMYVGLSGTLLATYDPQYQDARVDYVVANLALDGAGSVMMDGEEHYGGFSFYRKDPLPVELTSFTSKYLTDKIQLNWVTKTEVNNYGFNVERRINESEWNTIGFVEGHGNSNSPKEYNYADRDLFAGGSIFQYRLKQIDTDGQFEYSDVVEVEVMPTQFELSQNYPNPFNPSTMITYTIPGVISTEGRTPKVSLKVFDVLGNEVATLVDEEKSSGRYEVSFNAADLASGVYIYRLIAGAFVETKKMVLLR